MSNTLSFVAQLNVTQGEFAFERKFRCFLNDKWVDAICYKGETE